jgi:tetratricopeptide (TPR) repeat protein
MQHLLNIISYIIDYINAIKIKKGEKMKELLKRIKRDTEKELSRIRNELKNINENSKEHVVVVLKNSEKFLKQDLETLKKGVCEESIEVLLKHLRIEDEDTKATEDDVLGIGKHYMNKELFSKAKDLYKKVLNNNAFKIDSSYKNTIKKIINNDDSSNKLAKGGLNLFEEAYEKYEKRNYEKAFNLYEKAWNEFGEVTALHNLGNMYLFGEGVKKDHKKVIEYWELGAKNNLDISQFNMAIMYLGIEKLKVKGFKVDLKKGLELLLKAAKQGNENAIEMSKMVLKASETLIN